MLPDDDILLYLFCAIAIAPASGSQALLAHLASQTYSVSSYPSSIIQPGDEQNRSDHRREKKSMRCTKCGYPVWRTDNPFSPPRRNTNCLRCGAPIASATSQEDEHRPPSRAPGKSLRSSRARPSKTGYIVAGIGVSGAALILIFVYFMATGLSSNTSASVVRSSDRPTVTSSPSPLPASSLTPTPAASATPTDLPAHHFITKAQTATGVDFTNAQAINPTTTFRVNQRVYLTFHLHPGGQAGAVCLLWYLNGNETASLALPINPTDKQAYSYSIYRQAGSGYVDVYWASTTDCNDKSLAQHVIFNVTSA